MVLRHPEWRNLVLIIEDAKIDALFLSAAGKRRIENLVKQLAELDAVKSNYPLHDATVWSKRAYFDSALEDYPTFSDYLNADAQVVRDPHFESAIFKIGEGREEILNITKKNKVSGLLLKREILEEGEIADDFIL